ncbi:MAG: gliding motility-associated C-terminal domain-containing protein [Bacteroidota bacterium]
MKSLRKFVLFFCLLIFIVSELNAQIPIIEHKHDRSSGPLDFIENKNQWHKDVLFRTNFEGSNTLFIEKNGYTVLMTNPEDLDALHAFHGKSANRGNSINIRKHAYKVRYLNGQSAPGKGIARRTIYHNYIKGDNPEKWAGHVGLYGKVVQEDIYPGINVETYSQGGHLKYDFIVAPNANPKDIRISYSGVDKMELVEGNLMIQTSIGQITELAPVAWQVINDQKTIVPCYFSLSENVVSYSFPNNYDREHELIIDPTIIASTLTGTPGNGYDLGNFGHSATFDNAGNIYAAGISFVTSFPTTTGAFQQTYGGGEQDIAVAKFNPDGSNMVYATYIGGFGDEWPHSIITDFNQQLYIYGSTESSDYPVTINGFQQNFGGNKDIVVSILSQDGSALVGSSFFGGSAADGFNQNFDFPTWSYGDEYRGEIVIDGQNNVYVIGSTQSADFPITANAYDNTFNPNGFLSQDVVVLKANSDLSFLYWATYLGGDDLDSGNGIRVDEDLNVYVTGTAGAANFPTTPGTVQPNWPGGQESGFVAKLSANGSELLASTFFGSSGDDNSYFVDIDEEDQIHIYGKTKGIIPVTPPGTYSGVPGSNQFLAAFSNDMSSTVYSTVVGTGGSFLDYDFVPVAFMVDKCNGIYFSGYYAVTGLPVTADAFPGQQTTQDAFYLGVLTPNAEDLEFATYYGRSDHVDGGTSRFDKSGIIYQGVCSCTWPNNFTPLNTLPNAWATNQSNRCDIGVFKIDLEIESINANAIALPSTSGCAPFEVDFIFTGTNATDFEWSVDTGIISNLPDHNYTFNEPGTYEVQLAVSNPSACNPRDTITLEIIVLDGNTTSTFSTVCENGNVFLDAGTPGASYTWQDGSTAAGFVAPLPGIYWVDIDLGACERRDSFLVLPSTEVEIDLGTDTTLCDFSGIYPLDATTNGIVSYEWQDGSTDPIFEAISSGSYSLNAIDTNGCSIEDEILVLFVTTPIPDLGSIDTLCVGETVLLTPDIQNGQPLWQDGSNDPTFEINSPGEYWLELNDSGCKDSDTITVFYYETIFPNASASSIICASDCNGTAETVPSGGSGIGFTVAWSNGENTENLTELCPGPYTVTVTDSRGCTSEQTVEVTSPPPLDFVINIDNVVCFGDENGAVEVLNVSGGQAPYSYSFNGSDFSTVSSLNQLSGGIFEVVVIDDLGCTIAETVEVYEPEDFDINAGPDQEIELGETTEIEAIINPLTNQLYAWSPPDFLECTECLTSPLCPTETILYLLTVADPISGCTLQDSILITVNKTRRIYIPNAFSPNGDGVNDFFMVFSGIGVEQVQEFKVFDRWGELVFENFNFSPNDFKEGWDGSFKGDRMDPAVFAYYAKVLFKDGVSLLYEGDIHLIR